MPVVENSQNPACKVVSTHLVCGLQGTDEDETGKVANLPAEKLPANWPSTWPSTFSKGRMGLRRKIELAANWPPSAGAKLAANWPAACGKR